MIRPGSTFIFNTISSSALEAQSKPVPRAAKRRKTCGSGLHLTAGFVSLRRSYNVACEHLTIE